ncbi:MAG TPA: hypothetical protein VGE52_17385, partial [Pirellulales bacterium]
MTPRLAWRVAFAVSLSSFVGFSASAALAQQPPGPRTIGPGVPAAGPATFTPAPGSAPVAPPAMQVPPNAAAPAPQAMTPPPPAVAPFQLTPEQEAELNGMLIAWQNRGAKIKTLHCAF